MIALSSLWFKRKNWGVGKAAQEREIPKIGPDFADFPTDETYAGGQSLPPIMKTW